MVNWKERITADPQILVGKPIIKGTRISVELILDRIANGWSLETILEAYPHLTREDVLAAQAFATEMPQEKGVPRYTMRRHEPPVGHE